MAEQPNQGPAAFGGIWLAGLLWIFLTLAAWVFFYAALGDKLSSDATKVVALIFALIVFGGRWCWLRARRKPPTPGKESSK